jgi:AMP-binding enzyme C-terminal domain
MLQERRVFPPSAEASAHASVPSMDAHRVFVAEADQDHEGFWARLARQPLSWHKRFTSELDETTRRSTPGSRTARSTRRTTASTGTWKRSTARTVIFEADDGKQIVGELRAWVAKEIGPIAKPRDIRFGVNLPNVRSGRNMPRLMRSLVKGEETTQDVSTLEDSAILDQLGELRYV